LTPAAPRSRRRQGGKVLDPEWCRERARRARAAHDHPDRLIRLLVESAPQLTTEQAEQLRALLPAPSTVDGGDAA
jgi:hypothetical protein